MIYSVQNMIKKVDTITGSTLVAAHNGKDGQEIPHVHVHLIPRTKMMEPDLYTVCLGKTQ